MANCGLERAGRAESGTVRSLGAQFADFFFFALNGSFHSPGFFSGPAGWFTCRAFSRWNGYHMERFGVIGHIFADAFLCLNRQSSSINHAFRESKIGDVLLLFT